MSTGVQHLEALEEANRARREIGALRREVAAGELSAADALEDPRAQPLTIERLLIAQHRWGKTRVHRTLVALRWATDGGHPWETIVWPDMRIRDLTPRQKQILRSFLT